MYPINKYRYIVVNNKKVIAISSYGGKAVRGVAVCHDNDKFDLETGKRIAAARCAVKVAQKRLARAEKKMYEADRAVERAKEYVTKMECYYFDSRDALCQANAELDNMMEHL